MKHPAWDRRWHDAIASTLPVVRPDLGCFFRRVTSAGSAIAPHRHRVLWHEITLETLCRHAFVLSRKGSITHALIEGAFAGAGLSVQISVEAGGWEVVKRYVALGLGISVIPAFRLPPSDRPRLASRRLARLFGDEVYGIVTKRGRAPSPSASALISEAASSSRSAHRHP